jgi:hypothetical protein
VEQTLLHPIPLFSGPNPNLHDQVEDAVMEQSIQDDEFGYPILNPPKKRSHQETKLTTGLTIQQMAANFVLNRSKWDLLHVPGIENNFYFQSLQLNCPKTDSEEDNSSDIPSLIADSDSDDDEEEFRLAEVSQLIDIRKLQSREGNDKEFLEEVFDRAWHGTDE